MTIMKAKRTEKDYEEEALIRRTIRERGYAKVMIRLANGEPALLAHRSTYGDAQELIDFENGRAMKVMGLSFRMWIE